MTEEKYKVKFKDHKGNWKYTKSFTSRLSADIAQIAAEQGLIIASMENNLFSNREPLAKVVEVCPSCETENINTDGGDCYCAECGHKWSY